jgi:hypothetical protein
MVHFPMPVLRIVVTLMEALPRLLQLRQSA